jgi:hypothetical protein
VKKLQTHIPLPYAFNVKDTTQLINDLKNIPFDQNLRLASFDISNMYTNIPTDVLLTIAESAYNNNNVKENLKCDTLKLLKVIIDQNYSQFLGQTYVQNEGLAMGAPTSSILSEIYLQHLESSRIYNISPSFGIVGYFRYVDELLLIYERKTDIEDLLNCFNNITPKLNFTIEKETKGSINFLHITIHREENSFSIYIYRKPTYEYTHSIIPNDSCQPTEHKYAAKRYLQNRMNNYQLSRDKKERESTSK